MDCRGYLAGLSACLAFVERRGSKDRVFPAGMPVSHVDWFPLPGVRRYAGAGSALTWTSDRSAAPKSSCPWNNFYSCRLEYLAVLPFFLFAVPSPGVAVPCVAWLDNRHRGGDILGLKKCIFIVAGLRQRKKEIF